MNADYTVKDFAIDFRRRIGDSSQSVPITYIISYLNTALRRLARQPGLDKLFEHRDTFKLAAINADGTPSAAWDMGKVGTIIDIDKLRLLETKGGEVCELHPDYMEYDEFFDCNPLPEQLTPGRPRCYTIEQIGPNTRLLLNRPPKDMTTMDVWYSAFHPRITSENDVIQINWNYADSLEEYVIILHKIETTDQATARSLWEDLDILTADIRELLAKRKTTTPLRKIHRSF